MSPKPILQAKNIIKKYRMGTQVVSVLNSINLDVYPGEVVSLLGKSGCGKTTFLNIAAGLERPTKGEIIIDGHLLNKISESKMSVFRRKYIGFVFQLYNLIPSMNALENAILPLVFEGIPAREREQKGRELLKTMGLGDRLGHKPSEMSGGQRQRISLARAIINNPRIIFADEPTGNLDSRTTKEILDLLISTLRKNGQTLLMVTHDQEVARHGDRIIEMADGKIIGEKVM
ncbi:MAG TPA: ABC transporter ATP-binding protein [Firmicutes bacterium]|jgi:putative ABC transport system ATP-binding protein|nr:ABC transporter ATP-binding protein [Bacillota bacterium]